MSIIIGYNAFNDGSYLASDLPPINNINNINLTEGKFDEIYIRENTSNVDETNTKETWYPDTLLDAKFEDNLEAGNINNDGVKITQVKVKRRPSSSTTNLTIQTMPFTNTQQVDYIDATNPVGEFIYQVVPVGENGIEGKPNEISVSSDFYGWYIVDKNTMKTIQFDMTFGGYSSHSSMNVNNSVTTTLNQGRQTIETLNKYPQIYYNPLEYHTFDLSTVLTTETYTFDDYNNILDMITQHKPLLIKSASGDVYVVDVYSPAKTTLLNAWLNHDYGVIKVSATEIMSFDDYINS